jgi:predicted 3-demethylubiquinone-9 3-methyltransferase (glyoxalase superfamily)
MRRISTCLWFDGNAEEAANFYTSIFDHSRIIATSYFGPNEPGPEGSVLTVHFEIDGYEIMALNGRPDFKFNEAISLMVNCNSQAEIDRYWDALLADGGKPVQCGWLTDRFGVSWQVAPANVAEYLTDPDPKRRSRYMQAMMQMVKLDMDALERAVTG